jgi:hypothetical protein
MSHSQPKYDEQTIFLGNGWTLRARVQNGLVDSPDGGKMGANFKVVQFALITETQPHGFDIAGDDARTLLAWREALGPSVPLTAPEKAQVQLSPPAHRLATGPARPATPRRS